MAPLQIDHLESHPARGRRHGSIFLKLTLGEASTAKNQKQCIVNVCTFGDWMSRTNGIRRLSRRVTGRMSRTMGPSLLLGFRLPLVGNDVVERFVHVHGCCVENENRKRGERKT